MLYRVKQFFWSLTAKVKDSDKTFVNIYLNDYEKILFYSLPTYEQLHSIKVAREVLDRCIERELYDAAIVKAALLHDIGKINSGLNIITKSIMVILNKFMPNTMKKLKGNKAVNAFYNHPEIALTYLQDDYDYIKYLIRNHHNYSLKEDEVLAILQRADSNN